MLILIFGRVDVSVHVGKKGALQVQPKGSHGKKMTNARSTRQSGLEDGNGSRNETTYPLSDDNFKRPPPISFGLSARCRRCTLQTIALVDYPRTRAHDGWRGRRGVCERRPEWRWPEQQAEQIAACFEEPSRTHVASVADEVRKRSQTVAIEWMIESR